MITEIFTIKDHVVRDGESGIIKEISWLCLQNFYGLSNTLRVSLLIPVTGMMNKVSSSFVHSLSPAFTQLFWQPPLGTLYMCYLKLQQSSYLWGSLNQWVRGWSQWTNTFPLPLQMDNSEKIHKQTSHAAMFFRWSWLCNTLPKSLKAGPG